MKNAYAIGSAARQIIKVCERIDSLAIASTEAEIQGRPSLAETYDDQLTGQIADIQQLVLEITGIALPENSEENTDEGSAFAEGELNAVKGEENTDCGAENDQK